MANSRPEYTEEPRVLNDEAYYAELCKDEMVEVVMMPGKGKGVLSTVHFDIDDLVIEENALVCAQNLDDYRAGIKACGLTLTGLETPREALTRSATTSAMREAELPKHDEYVASLLPQVCTPCDNASTGCRQCYSSAEAREAHWKRSHRCLCEGTFDKAQAAAYKEFTEESWIQGGVDYSDTYNIAMHMFAIMFSGMMDGKTVAEVALPFEQLISCPWERFVFNYLLDDDDDGEAEADPESEAKRSKEFVLAKAMRLLRGIFKAAEDDELLTEHRLTRLLGAILLNGQERTPTSSWTSYTAWVKGACARSDYKSMKSISKNYSKLGYTTRGQGVYKVCACFNHSCEPNIQVSYGDANDETLVVNAIREINKGDEVCISYIDEDADYATRQSQLQEHYLFKCLCPKCTREEAELAKKK
eukprot:TRINITY_DN8873_c0_g1_i1.p1 TRINITY_DN8873_c0_g1~~TRINITY_DN8873_c0_g1_i1.p1  ORF type:complete len:417 (+),score=171.96 TRINITY_DN8873_c0_g1_i1:63-1313(+)